MDARDLYPTQNEAATQFTMDLKKVGVTQAIPSGLHRLKYAEEPGFFHDEMLARLTAYVLSEHLAADTVEKSMVIPNTWWDHLKVDARDWARRRPCRILTSWWTRRYPPEFETRTLAATWTRAATRPMSKIKFADNKLGPVIYQEQVSHSIWSSND